jgi:fumarate reductase flavoprotein subunit
MHAVSEKTGRAFMAALNEACSRAGIDILCEAQVTSLHADSNRRVRGVSFSRRGEAIEDVGCNALVLACSGFGGNPDMVKRHIPELAGVDYFGHTGNQGDGVAWGEALGAAVADMTAYQGHGSVATPHGILITWALMMEGGIQVNALGERFSNEHEGYSEQCVNVLAQPGRVAWNIYDERLHRLGLEFPDYRDAVAAGAIKSAPNLELLASQTGLPVEGLKKTVQWSTDLAAGKASDAFGRDFSAKPPLQPPYYAVKVTGSLFHTQGGLIVNEEARVCDARWVPFPNLFAGGGAARGISGAHVWGYLSGNGLLSAVSLGWISGRASARLALDNSHSSFG